MLSITISSHNVFSPYPVIRGIGMGVSKYLPASCEPLTPAQSPMWGPFSEGVHLFLDILLHGQSWQWATREVFLYFNGTWQCAWAGDSQSWGPGVHIYRNKKEKTNTMMFLTCLQENVLEAQLGCTPLWSAITSMGEGNELPLPTNSEASWSLQSTCCTWIQSFSEMFHRLLRAHDSKQLKTRQWVLCSKFPPRHRARSS